MAIFLEFVIALERDSAIRYPRPPGADLRAPR